jgi:mannose-6-phosphate isomerase-like protein (cupin superfamily)
VGTEIKNIGSPDETRKFAAHGWADVLTLPGMTLMRATFQPGWRWSADVKPLAGTDSCQVHHNGYVLSGRLHIVMDDGTEYDLGPGDAFVCPPGHDAYVVGDEDCVSLDFSSAAAGSYAKNS